MSWSVCTKSLLGLYYFSQEDSKTVEIVTNLSEAGELKMLNHCKNSQIAINLNLCIGKIDDFKKYNRENLYDFFPKFFERNKNDYKEEYDVIFDEIKKYEKIRFIFNEYNSNSILNIYYCIYRFYNNIKDKTISLAEFDFHKKNKEKYEYACENEKILTLEEIENYKLKWEEELNKNSEVRNIENGEIKDYSINDITLKILDFIKMNRPKDTYELILELAQSNILNIQSGLFIYNYIVEYMIAHEIIKTDNSKKLALNNQIRFEKIIL